MKRAITVVLLCAVLFVGCAKIPVEEAKIPAEKTESKTADNVTDEISKAVEELGLKVTKLEFGDDSLYAELSPENTMPESSVYVPVLTKIQECLLDNGSSVKKIDVKLVKEDTEKTFELALEDRTVYITLPSDGDGSDKKANMMLYMDAFAYLLYNMPSDVYDYVNVKVINHDGDTLRQSLIRFSRNAEKRIPADGADPAALIEPVKSVLPVGMELTEITIVTHNEIPIVALALKCSVLESASLSYIDDVYEMVIKKSANMNIAACTIDIVDASTGELLMYYYGNADIGKMTSWLAPEIRAFSGPRPSPDSE